MKPRDCRDRRTVTVDEAVRRGEIPTIRIGRRLLVPRGALDELLGAAETQGAVGSVEFVMEHEGPDASPTRATTIVPGARRAA